MTAVSTPLRPGAMIAGTPASEALMARKAQVFIHHAIDLYLGELARQGRRETTRAKYRSVLDPFGDQVRHKLPDEVTADDCRLYLDRWVNASPSTLALYVTVLRRFFDFCEDEQIVKRSPAAKLKRPRRHRPEDLDVVTVSTADVHRMLTACADWQERLCIAVVFYMGVRKTAAANARRRDVDLDAGVMRFREKGDKVIAKPIPNELLALLRYADQHGQWLGPEEYLIPNRKPWLVKSAKRRGSKVIYETVVRVAERAGVRSHVHALRAAFAVQFDEQHPGRAHDLKALLGHAHLSTQEPYLRRKNTAAAMETVRDLTVFPASAVIPPAGFEPAFGASADQDRDATVTPGRSLPDELLEQARSKANDQEPNGRVDPAERVPSESSD